MNPLQRGMHGDKILRKSQVNANGPLFVRYLDHICRYYGKNLKIVD